METIGIRLFRNVADGYRILSTLIDGYARTSSVYSRNDDSLHALREQLRLLIVVGIGSA